MRDTVITGRFLFYFRAVDVLDDPKCYVVQKYMYTVYCAAVQRIGWCYIFNLKKLVLMFFVEKINGFLRNLVVLIVIDNIMFFDLVLVYFVLCVIILDLN